MPRPFLEIFPREIRDQIYTFLLASRSGQVTLSPWTTEVARSLSIVRTCKQIRRECKDIIWQHNRMNLREHTQLSQKLRDTWKEKCAPCIRHLHISLTLLDRDELEWMVTGLPTLSEWSSKGALKSITLSTSNERPRGMAEFHEELALLIDGSSVDGRLYRECPSSSTMVINTGWPQISHWGKQRWLKEMLLDPSHTEELLKQMHDTLGGELWINGVLCLKDHAAVVEVLNFNPRDADVQFIFEGNGGKYIKASLPHSSRGNYRVFSVFQRG
jgi:hypothetical protein